MSKQDKKELRQQIACEWLQENYLQFESLRHDVVADRLQVRCAHSLGEEAIGRLGERQELWRNLTDKDINTMVCQCVAESGVNISVTEMWTALKSDMVPAVHPLRAWLQELQPWTPDRPDWIDFIARQVHVKTNDTECGINKDNLNNLCARPTLALAKEDISPLSQQQSVSSPLSNVGEAEELSMLSSEQTNPLSLQDSPADRLWRACFKKWFVAMVASWMNDEVVNHTVLVLVGRQGIFKTTWLDNLIPPGLRAYSSKLPLSGQISKDDRLRLCENGMLNIDELDAMCGREMNIVKSLLTSTDVNERAAYGRLKERRVRLASFCASTNKREFLTDITGNRRWLPFEVESIQNPFHTIIPYERLYAQAKALVEEGIFSYWFDMEEMEVLEAHNEEFRAQENEEQLLPILFDVPAEGRGEFMTTAEISDRLATYGGIKKPMSIRKLNAILEHHAFKAVRPYVDGKQVRGWLVYKRKQDEIEIKQKELANKSQRHEDILLNSRARGREFL